MSTEVSRDNYETEVLTASLPVMVDFWGPQCKPCLILMPAVEQLETEYTGKIKVAKLNASENRMLCAKLRVMGLPTFLFYKDGAEIKRLTGDRITKIDLEEALKVLLA